MSSENHINQNQFFDLITGEELSWQTIIYDLIKTEQLDPWDIDIGLLADRYVEIIQKLEEANFFISSKVLLACSLLLRLKSEILINSYIQSLDDALYGRKEEKRYEIERLEIDENELPLLVPRTPMARHKKVTLTELMNALNHAIDTETRRIKREIKDKQAEKSALTVLPKISHIPLKVRVKNVFEIIHGHIKQGNDHMKFSHLAPDKEEKLASFVPVLHLANSSKIYLRQPVHFEEIHMTLKMHDEELEALKLELGFAEEGVASEPLEEFPEELTEEFQ
jgi:segregation and condensation protein A